MYILNVVFAAIASIAGSMLDAYAIPYFDKVLHFCSGFFDHLTGIHPIFLFYEENRLSKSARTALLHFLLQCV